MKFFLQSKNGNYTGWETIGVYKDFRKGSQACEQKMKQKRGSSGYEWYKTRLVDENYIRVYPPQKNPKKQEEVLKN